MRYQYFNYRAKKTRKNGIVFDSKLECKVYSLLEKRSSNINIIVHGKISTGWKVDFILTPKDRIGANIITKLANTGYASTSLILYLEVKGVIDKNFLRRYQQIVGTPTERMFVLVSQHVGAFSYVNTEGQIILKPVLSIDMLTNILLD